MIERVETSSSYNLFTVENCLADSTTSMLSVLGGNHVKDRVYLVMGFEIHTKVAYIPRVQLRQ